MPIFVEISVIVVIATVVSIIFRLFRQPLIIGYIATGILVGPYALNLLQAHAEVELFSKIGIAILLFIVGLTLNPDVMREVGKTSLVTGIGQIVFTSIIGFFIVQTLGFGLLASVYVAIALTFSSTIIILKLLSDRGDTQKLYGKISVGFLLVQDIVATLILLAITVMGKISPGGEIYLSNLVFMQIGILVGKGLLLALALYLISKYVLPLLSSFVANQQEVLFIFSLAWGLGLASLFYFIGFSIEIGALVAGITLAVSPFSYEMASRLKPLRDFFIMLFFVILGAGLVVGEVSALIVPSLILSAFVLIGNPLIVLVLMNLLGYRTRTAFMSGLTVAQISEFSLILISLGLSFGHVNQEVVSLVTLVGIITISISTYLILYADQIYAVLKPVLKLVTFRKSIMSVTESNKIGADTIIFGYDRVGHEFVKVAKKLSQDYLVVDFSPVSIEKLKVFDIPYRYGDAEDVEFLDEIGFREAKLVISTIPDFKTNLLLVSTYRETNPGGIIIVISHYIEDARALYEAGASYVVMPHHLGASHAASLIESYGLDTGAFELEKEKHFQGYLNGDKHYA